MAAVTVPMPRLEYGLWSRADGLDYTFGGDLPLASVHEVTVGLDRTGAPSVWVTGRMLKKDGTPGPRRSSQADLNTLQPNWLRQLLIDALPRLGVADVLHFEREEA